MISKPTCVVFDLDGTLADITHRLHHLKQKPKDWVKFQRGVLEDKPKKEIITLFKLFYKAFEIDIIISSGRNEEVRKETERWLDQYGLYPDKLLMRPLKDYRPDYIVKREMLDVIREDYDILFVVDDRKQVVDMWRENGVICLQCAPGDF